MITRRVLIAGSLATAATASGLYWLGESGRLDHTTNEELIVETGLGQHFDNHLKTLDTSSGIAEAWLASLATPPTLEALHDHFRAYSNGSTDAIEIALNQRIKEDFASNNTCHLEGWTLALTECRLAGLRYLAITSNPKNKKILQQQKSESQNNEFTEGEIAPLAEWGNKSTSEGKKFNEQPDGHSGLWFQFENAPAHVKITIDGEITPTVVSEKVVTSGLFGDMQERILSTPGLYEIALIDPISKVKQIIGNFEVKADPRQAKIRGETDSIFCKVTEWGPQKTQAGIAANEQPDGSMGIWIHTDCFPSGAEIHFIDDRLSVTAREFGLTTRIPLPLLGTPGEHPLYFYDKETKEKQLIGHISIE